MHFFNRYDEQASGAGEDKWPHTFQTYESYKADLTHAISADPNFGVWLSKYRNVNHLIKGRRDTALWDLSINELKQRYIEEESKALRTSNAKRAFIEMHLALKDNDYTNEEKRIKPVHESAERAYATALAAYEEAVQHGYKKVPRPQVPSSIYVKSELLGERDFLARELRICKGEEKEHDHLLCNILRCPDCDLLKWVDTRR